MAKRIMTTFVVCVTLFFGLSMTAICDENTDSVVIEETGAWTVDEYVDDFGDGIGIKYAKSIAEGTFSNSATNGSDLTVITFFDPEIEEFSFRLLEYNNSKANYYDGDLLRILFKFDDEIEEHLLQGSSISGDLCLSVYKEYEEAQDLTDSLSNDPDPEKAYSKAGLELALLAVSLAHSPEKSSGYYQLYNNLADGNDARCVIYIDSSKYSFTIPADGFSEAISVLYEDKYKEAEQLLSEKKYDEAIEAFENLNGYSDSADKILEAEYEKAGSLIDEGKYEEAQELFTSLEDYADSAKMVEKCKELIKEEEVTGHQAYNILQLRLHDSIAALKKRISEGPADKVYDVDLTYITSRGKWYYTSWKGNNHKSGGVATNIGVHFYDMLQWIFGPVQENIVHVMSFDRVAGYLGLKKARVRYFLSINSECLPPNAVQGEKKTYRTLHIDNDEFEFSTGFTELHTKSYQNILAGNGFRISEALPCIKMVHDIRNAKPVGLVGDYHPLAKMPLAKHPFGWNDVKY